MEQLYGNELVKTNWVSKKSGILPDTDGWKYYELPSLKRVEWIFLRTRDELVTPDYDSDWDSESSFSFSEEDD